MIDAGNQADWPKEVTERLPLFRQGSLVAKPPFVYQANSTKPIWEASRLVDAEADVLIDLDFDDRPAYGIVTTQSCDVDEEGTNQKPWVQVAPVYELPPDDGRLHLVKLWAVNYLAPIPVLGGGWVGDLRIEVPVEKSWLVEHEPTDAFVIQADRDRFSEQCGRYRSRRAVATGVIVGLLKPLDLFLRGLSKSDPTLFAVFRQRVTELFLELAGDALSPSAAGLIFVSDSPLPDILVQRLEGWWDELEPLSDFTIVPSLFLVSSEVSLSVLRRWYPQDLARLGGS